MLSAQDRKVVSRLLASRRAQVLPHNLPAEAREVTPETPEGTDLVVYRFINRRGKPSALVYQGRAAKPLYWYYFNSEEQRERRVQDTIKSRREDLQRKQQELQTRREWKHSAKVGDVLYTVWGYDQTNADFFQVVEVGDKVIKVRPLKQKLVESHEGYDKVKPDINHFAGPAVKKVPQMSGTGYRVRFDHGVGQLWSGNAVSQTSPNTGH